MTQDLATVFNSDQIGFIPLGGCGEIGMNMNLYFYKGKFIIVDCGVTFEEGYGVEILTPDPKFIADKKEDILGLVITHGHEDHIGAIPYLWPLLQCPIYATAFTATLIGLKLQEVGLAGKVTINIVEVGVPVELGDFNIEFVHVTHSIPEPNMLAIKTPAGTVLHTGDWKFDPDPVIGEVSDMKRLEALGKGGVLALVCDSTNVMEPSSKGSEQLVQDNIIEFIKQNTKVRVVVACFASNLARIYSCIKAAKATKRKICFVGFSLHRIIEAATKVGYEGFTDFVDVKNAMKYKPHEILIVCTGSQGEERSALFKIANKCHPFVSLDRGDVVIFSSRVIPGNEKLIGYIKNSLMLQGVCSFSNKDMPIHVSGHPCRDELTLLYKTIQPKIVVPVHGELRHLIAQAFLAEQTIRTSSVVGANGVVLLFTQEGVKFMGRVPVGKLALDYGILVPTSDIMMKQREQSGVSGTLFVSIFSEDIINVSHAGVFFINGDKTPNYLKDIGNAVKKSFISYKKTSANNKNDKEKAGLLPINQKQAMMEYISNDIKHFLLKHYKKTPVIMVHVGD